MRTLLSCLAAFCFEIVFIFAIYTPHSRHGQAGLMLILVLEMSFVIAMSKSNIEEKRMLGKVSPISRAQTTVLGLATLGMLALGSGLLQVAQSLPIWVALFVVSACAKIAWIWTRSRTGAMA